MTSRFFNMMFTPAVKAAQAANGSRQAYAGHDDAAAEPDRLTEKEAAFIAARDSFYMATVGEGGWPYIQHRGGPSGFVRVLSDRTLGLADFRGNRQYVSVGNLSHDNRVSLFFMDYPRRARLKLIGRARIVDLDVEPKIAAALADKDYRAKAERGLLIDVEAFDWNCPQHITQRFTLEDFAPETEALKARIAALEAELVRVSSSR